MFQEQTLAKRLGQSVHVSPLRVKLRRLMARDPGINASCLEDWLLDLANLRGVRSVSRSHEHLNLTWRSPSIDELTNEESIKLNDFTKRYAISALVDDMREDPKYEKLMPEIEMYRGILKDKIMGFRDN